MASNLNQFGELLKNIGYVPKLPAIDVSQPLPRGKDAAQAFPNAPVGLPADWDYRTSKVGPDGKELPRGAIGWTPNGDAFYGGNSALANWWNGLASRAVAPSQVGGPSGADRAADAIQALMGQDEYAGQPLLGRLGAAVSNGFSAFGTALNNFMTDENGAPTPLTMLSRLVSEGITGTVTAVSEVAEEVEQVRGGIIGAAGGEQNPWSQWLQNTTDQYLGDAWGGDFFRSLIHAVDVPGMLWDTARAIVAPTKDKGKAFSEGYEAGRILYSQFIDPAIREEYVRRFRAGENPYLLAEELQNPLAELGGELIADPLNYIGGVLTKFGLTRKAGFNLDAVNDFAKLDPELDRLVQIGKVANEAEGAGLTSRFVQRTMGWTDEIRTGLNKVDDKLTSLDAVSKRAAIAGRTGSVAWTIVASQANKPNKADAVIDIFRALIDLHSEDAAKVGTAVDVIKQSGMPLEVLMSRVGGELGYVLKNVVGDSPQKFYKELQSATSADDLFTKFGSRLDGAIDQIVPTFAERAKKGEVLSTRAKVFMNAEKITKSDPYRFSRKFFGSLYMGYNPGYAARNALQNYLQLFVDEGLGTVIQDGRLFTPTRARDFIQKAIGRVPDSASKGIGAAEGVASGPFSKLASQSESGAALQVFAKSMKDTLRKSYDVMFRDLGGNLIGAGVAEGDVRLMRNLLGETHDVNLVNARLEEMYRQGYVDVYREFEWLDDDSSKILDGFNGLDAYKEKMLTATSREEVAAINNDFFKRHFEDYAKETAKVPPGVPPELMDEAMAIAAEANQQGHIADDVLALSVNQRKANQIAEDKFLDLIDEMDRNADRLGINLKEVYAKVPGSELLTDKKLMTEARREFFDWAEGLKAKFNDLYKRTDLSVDDMAKQLGIQEAMPPELSRAAFRQYFWENHWIPRERNYFNVFKDAYVGIANAVIDEAGALDPRLINGAKRREALLALGDSKLWEKAAITADGLGVAGAGKEVDSIRKLATLNGIQTASGTGTNLDGVLLKTINKYSDVKYADLTQVPFAEAKKALQARAAEKGVAFYAIEGTFAPRGFATDLIPPWIGDATPDPSRMVAEQLSGLRELKTSLAQKAQTAFGNQRALYRDPKIEEAIKVFTKEANERVIKSKLVAEQVAKATRDFALLDYSQRKNYDAILGLIYPYHYWHSRTYVNWMKRITSNPGVIAAYGKYRDTLAEIHAGMPDWWKYNINTNELFGVDHENPLFFNLEATLNPLNGLTGVDFNDPEKRVNWWTATLDDLGKLGPAPWTMFSVAAAVVLQMQGEDDAAARWGGRLIPQTATIEAAANLAGAQPFNLDPFVSIFSGGVDPYTRNRVGRALSAMVLEGQYTEEQVIDAAATQTGAIWTEGLRRAINERAAGQLSSFFLGVGFKGRSIGDLQADQFYQDYYRIIRMRSNMSPDQYQQEMNGLRERFPFMDALLLSKKSGGERDTALAYNVLSRLPPGGSTLTQAVGIDQRILSQFYDTKGDWTKWSDSDKDRFMAGVVDMMGVLATPADATRQEWTQVKSIYAQMSTQLKDYFGADIEDRIDGFYERLSVSQESADAYLAANPAVDAAMDAKKQYIATNPLLTTYYGGYEAIAKYYKTMMYDDIREQMGDIFSKFNDGSATRSERSKYAKIRDQWNALIDEAVLRIGKSLPEAKPAEIRTDAQPTSVYQQDFIDQLQPQIDLNQVVQQLGAETTNLVLDLIEFGQPLPNSARNRIEDIAEQYGLSYYELLEMLEQGQ